MWKNLRKGMADKASLAKQKATEAKQVADEKSHQAAESFIENNWPVIRVELIRAIDKLGEAGKTAAQDTRSRLVDVVADEKKFKQVLESAYKNLPRKFRPMPCKMFVHICAKKRENILNLVPPNEPSPRQTPPDHPAENLDPAPEPGDSTS